MSDAKVSQKKSSMEIIQSAGKRALGGGLPGAAAMAIQVCTLMPLRTTMNYQYRNGMSTSAAVRILYQGGGIGRFYKGILPALFQGPLSRFGDTAANSGVLALMDSYETTAKLPLAFKTMCASGSAALWRINLMPIDTVKTIMQVEGAKGLPTLVTKFKTKGPSVFYHGALAASAATFVGHYPWFFTYNLLDAYLPKASSRPKDLARNAAKGFISSVVSDTISNSIRVIKTTKQTNTESISYPEAVRMVYATDGLSGIFFRGLRTRILANAMQGMLFSVLWKGLEEQYLKRTRA